MVIDRAEPHKAHMDLGHHRLCRVRDAPPGTTLMLLGVGTWSVLGVSEMSFMLRLCA